MQLGVIGLGRMGANIVRRLTRNGHTCVIYNRSPGPVQELVREGAVGAASVEELVEKLSDRPTAVWVMLPAGRVTEEMVWQLAGLMRRGDIIIDGGNSYYKDDIRRGKELAPKDLHYVDVGTSGGVWGLERGFCMM